MARARGRRFLIDSRAMITVSSAGATTATAAGGSGMGSGWTSRAGVGASGTGLVGTIQLGSGSHDSPDGVGSIDAIKTEPWSPSTAATLTRLNTNGPRINIDPQYQEHLNAQV